MPVLGTVFHVKHASPPDAFFIMSYWSERGDLSGQARQ